jgi:hypothetical protein
MIELYYWPTPKGHKVTMLLEEAGLDYMIQSVDISAGDQFRPGFLAILPNSRMPAIVDTARRRTDCVRVRCHPVVLAGTAQPLQKKERILFGQTWACRFTW